ncbi:MAG: hypothetical protein A2233_04950 [Candidatus Kerfeldbacteria bacterium RIFOXYA2_FULL_38_24]|uniref:Cyclodipeptide synthase n=1 Tax=Candidatus Kerfeldbacteria bacterium RIFOXYB2_FULL_38_14 TaxID=1798547 RepID=A0A1G2B8Y8_9BACT|nr:MAG: hypothetical protein A2233_04950 [Candidatus Kerfeldbacteria bacterium RIFOXYA2_FULL_38_24]OGY85673.1 MAG: hypothetical protein A2319_05220 [Candidatus Kerfeldbacteria bacterium RIFOXYB2_FULL_38_14]OGY88359.1 MAG: hypothetical protein A2458_02755 [Candidatus Kerfeldbacteria bacterium RIFOXYC2_FULL_38_9]
MKAVDQTTHYVIGMSPGNSYFKDEEIHYLLKTTVEKFGRVAVLIADIPAISTYIALGYPENRARRDKALPKGNALKNRVLKAMDDLHYSNDVVKIIQWDKEVENNPLYKEKYEKILALYNSNNTFRSATNATTRAVLEGSQKTIPDIEKATKIAAHYLLSEFAFLEFAPLFFGVKKVVYIYHKNWTVFESYIAGKYDNTPKLHIDFLLLENPYETYNPIWGLEDNEDSQKFSDVLERIEKKQTLRVGFIHSTPTFMYDRDYDNFSGIFYELIIETAKKFNWKIQWTEETGYGVITDALNTNRFDIFGSTVWPTPERIEEASFSESLFKSPIFSWVRSDDGRTEQQLKTDVYARVAIKENDISDYIAKSDFAKNRVVKVPQLSDNRETLRFVADGRADFTFVEPYLAEHFNEDSPMKVIAASKQPLRIYDNTFMFKQGEKRLKKLLDSELSLLKENGTVKKLIKKYTDSENAFILEEKNR